MMKEELLEYLLNNIHVFDNVEYEDFCLLASMDASELSLMNKNTYKVTPLLKQICNYAIIADFLENDEANELKKVITDEREETILSNVSSIITACYRYIDLLIANNCNHPSILNLINIRRCCISYSNMFDIICELIKKLKDEFSDDLLKLSTEIDDKIIGIIEKDWANFIKKVTDYGIANERDLLIGLRDYAKKQFIVCSLIENNNITCNDDYYTRMVSKEKVARLSFGDNLNFLADIMIKALKYQDYSSDDEIIELIDDLKKTYYLYSSYRSFYLKNDYKEEKMIEKCKKM